MFICPYTYSSLLTCTDIYTQSHNADVQFKNSRNVSRGHKGYLQKGVFLSPQGRELNQVLVLVRGTREAPYMEPAHVPYFSVWGQVPANVLEGFPLGGC